MADVNAHIAVDADWSNSVRVSWEFKTDIFRSRQGYETRSALREFPRVLTEFSVLGGRSGTRTPKATYAANLAKRVGFPDMTQKRTAELLTQSVLEGDFDDHRFSVGEPIYVEHNGALVASTVDTNTKTRISIATPLQGGRGDEAFVYPALEGRIADSFSARHRTSTVFDTTVSFEAYAAQGRIKDLLGWAPAQWYRDRPVALWAPNWRERVQEDWSRDEYAMDTGYGVPWFEAKRKSPDRSSSYTLLVRNQTEADDLISFFCHCRGRQGSFYAPTWVDDFIFLEPVSEGQTQIEVKGHGALDLFEGSDVYRNVAVRLGANFHLAGIVDMQKSGDNSVLTLAQPVPAEIAGANRASWLLRQRFSTDKLEMDYRTDRVAEVDIKTVSVFEDFPVVQMDGFELTMGGYYVTIGSSRDIEEPTLTTFGGFAVSIGGDYLE